MKKWTVILQQHDEGCDYMIGCGTAVKVVQGDTEAEALEAVKQLLEDYGHRADDVSLFPNDASVAVPMQKWEAEEKAEFDRIAAAEQEKKDRAELERLQKKLGS